MHVHQEETNRGYGPKVVIVMPREEAIELIDDIREITSEFDCPPCNTLEVLQAALRKAVER